MKDWIHEKYWAIHLKVAKAESLNPSEKRQKWMRRLESEGSIIEKLIEKEGSLSRFEVIPSSERLDKLKEEVEAENKAADALWERTNERYADERERLQDAGDYKSELALEFLDEAFDEYERRINAVTKTDALVRDDIAVLVTVLNDKIYVKNARIVAERERAEAEEQLASLSEVEEEGPGFLETAWSIIGCESVGECLGDVALTVATGGAGKAVKATIKGAKAVNKARKARKVIRSAKKLGQNLEKVLKEARALDKFAGAVKGSAPEAALSFGKWLKKDWKKVASKISTDLIATNTTGEGMTAGTTAVARINKEFVGHFVEKDLGIQKPDPDLIKIAIIFFMKKKSKTAASLARTFILQSLKYRTTVNLSFESLRAATPLTERDDIFRRVLISTTAECAQDVVQAIPFIGESEVKKYITEAIRKMIQQIFG